jgi:hypothetical protein
MSLVRRFALALIAAALALSAGQHATAAAYDFVVRASSLRPVQPDTTIPPSIDETGAVEFVGVDLGAQWVLVASEPGARLLAD